MAWKCNKKAPVGSCEMPVLCSLIPTAFNNKYCRCLLSGDSQSTTDHAHTLTAQADRKAQTSKNLGSACVQHPPGLTAQWLSSMTTSDGLHASADSCFDQPAQHDAVDKSQAQMAALTSPAGKKYIRIRLEVIFSRETPLLFKKPYVLEEPSAHRF